MSDNDQKTTAMLETLLKRMTVLTTEFQSFHSTVEQRLTGIEEEMRKGHAETREEMNQGFRKMERRLDVVSVDINKLRADMQYLESQTEKLVEKLEQQPA